MGKEAGRLSVCSGRLMQVFAPPRALSSLLGSPGHERLPDARSLISMFPLGENRREAGRRHGLPRTVKEQFVPASRSIAAVVGMLVPSWRFASAILRDRPSRRISAVATGSSRRGCVAAARPPPGNVTKPSRCTPCRSTVRRPRRDPMRPCLLLRWWFSLARQPTCSPVHFLYVLAQGRRVVLGDQHGVGSWVLDPLSRLHRGVKRGGGHLLARQIELETRSCMGESRCSSR